MKISDLLGEGWESEERSDASGEPRPMGADAAASGRGLPSPGDEPVTQAASDVIPSLASWAPAPPLQDPPPPAAPVSARAQLADLAAGLGAAPPPVALEPEPELPEGPDPLAGLDLVVDDLLPDATKRARGSSRGSSRSGSRRRGR